jgi:hypothetical protein
MAQLKNIHNSVHQLNTAATNAYAVIRSHTITNLGKIYGASSPSTMRYKLGTLYVKLDTLAGLSATPTLTVRLTRDVNGNDTVVGDVTAAISLGVTAATEGAVTVQIDFTYSHNDAAGTLNDTLHLFWRLDQGTGNVRRIELTTEG